MTYIDRVLEEVKEKNADQPEFIQAVEEVLTSLEPVIEQHPEYEQLAILERLVEPERIITFKVSWVDDNNQVQVNRGYRVQFNGLLGPYKGGLRFHPSVNTSIVKFLGFEQTFKNSLTGLPIGGGKGGSDFDPIGKSDGEIMRFCQAFMNQLAKHIGPDIDVPAGDIGVGAREIGYLYGQYRQLKGAFENGVLTGKPLVLGGSLIRPEATGYGVLYYAQEILNHFHDSLQGKRIAISGFGNVAWGVCLKARDLGAKVVSISGPDGFVYDPEGVNTDKKIDFMTKMRIEGKLTLADYAKEFNCEFFPNQKPWNLQVDVIIPCATQNEITIEDAKNIVDNNIKYVVEAANMPTTPEAVTYLLDHDVIVGPSKAANAGGVAVSALEMAQNASRHSWSAEDVDEKLQDIMKSIHKNSIEASKKYGFGYDLIRGANIAGFEKVVEAMIIQGVY